MSTKLYFLVFVIIGMTTATWQNGEDSGCDGCDEGMTTGGEGGQDEPNNKFALLFRQMLAKQREANVDCALNEDCPEGFECFTGKCKTMGPRRTKVINLYSRW